MRLWPWLMSLAVWSAWALTSLGFQFTVVASVTMTIAWIVRKHWGWLLLAGSGALFLLGGQTLR